MTRPRLQLHLSTLLIVSLLVAGLVGLNVKSESFVAHYFTETVHEEPEGMFEFRGWPFNYSMWAVDARAASYWSPTFHVWRLALNIAVCLALLAVAAVAIEWGTRRVKRKATPCPFERYQVGGIK